ncbi:hypothetical protein LR48_Vigan280s000100 [Vigna angularis]|uniref:Uncharacterized protein n=1 Tax=Phaseolus angularis TaxID=3914 RepID=A0A0L9T838_PHAAN|nr:hypothetical protein LR48_Vigan280s000100 [Vigna angularis]
MVAPGGNNDQELLQYSSLPSSFSPPTLDLQDLDFKLHSQSPNLHPSSTLTEERDLSLHSHIFTPFIFIPFEHPNKHNPSSTTPITAQKTPLMPPFIRQILPSPSKFTHGHILTLTATTNTLPEERFLLDWRRLWWLAAASRMEVGRAAGAGSSNAVAAVWFRAHLLSPAVSRLVEVVGAAELLEQMTIQRIQFEQIQQETQAALKNMTDQIRQIATLAPEKNAEDFEDQARISISAETGRPPSSSHTLEIFKEEEATTTPSANFGGVVTSVQFLFVLNLLINNCCLDPAVEDISLLDQIWRMKQFVLNNFMLDPEEKNISLQIQNWQLPP